MTQAGEAKIRCPWCEGSALYQAYHDEEWGRPVHDDRLLFEFLILEGAQAGLSWITVLKRRAGYRQAFSDFDAARLAAYDALRVEQLMGDVSIIRNRAKIVSAVNNAARFLEVVAEFGSFDRYIWGFTDGRTIQSRYRIGDAVPAETDESKAMSRDLKKRGFTFVGPTICYAYMQAVGMVNDHYLECWTRAADK